MPPNDAAAIQQTKSLYQDHHSWLRALLFRRMGCHHDAADVAHDAFLKLLKKSLTFENSESARAYLSTTARHLLIDRARHRAIENAYLAELSLHTQIQGAAPSEEQIALTVETLEGINRVLERVDAKARQAFVLCYIDGMTQAQAARKMGVTSRSIRNYLAKVLVRCQQVRAN